MGACIAVGLQDQREVVGVHVLVQRRQRVEVCFVRRGPPRLEPPRAAPDDVADVVERLAPGGIAVIPPLGVPHVERIVDAVGAGQPRRLTAQASQHPVFLQPPHLRPPPAAGRAYHPDGVELTYGETRRAVRGMREAYAAAGYGHGHRVALLLENRPEFFFHYLALNALGVGIVPINPDYRHDEMLYQMEHSEADLAVVIASRVRDLEAGARERTKPLPRVAGEATPAALPPP